MPGSRSRLGSRRDRSRCTAQRPGHRLECASGRCSPPRPPPSDVRNMRPHGISNPRCSARLAPVESIPRNGTFELPAPDPSGVALRPRVDLRPESTVYRLRRQRQAGLTDGAPPAKEGSSGSISIGGGGRAPTCAASAAASSTGTSRERPLLVIDEVLLEPRPDDPRDSAREDGVELPRAACRATAFRRRGRDRTIVVVGPPSRTSCRWTGQLSQDPPSITVAESVFSRHGANQCLPALPGRYNRPPCGTPSDRECAAALAHVEHIGLDCIQVQPRASSRSSKKPSGPYELTAVDPKPRCPGLGDLL